MLLLAFSSNTAVNPVSLEKEKTFEFEPSVLLEMSAT